MYDYMLYTYLLHGVCVCVRAIFFSQVSHIKKTDTLRHQKRDRYIGLAIFAFSVLCSIAFCLLKLLFVFSSPASAVLQTERIWCILGNHFCCCCFTLFFLVSLPYLPHSAASPLIFLAVYLQTGSHLIKISDITS